MYTNAFFIDMEDESSQQDKNIAYLDKIEHFAKLDYDREERTGIPEVIFSETKAIPMILQITQKMLEKNHYAILSRVTDKQNEAINDTYKNNKAVTLLPNEMGRIIFLHDTEYEKQTQQGKIGIITAGTSDISVAEESKTILETMGFTVEISYDVGIAGFHRIFTPLKEMIRNGVDVFIVIAGMEGTLPGVVSALVDVPVIAVPTSTGYGIGAKGMSALSTMLQSCSPGMAVVNIDNGFGAASMAALILKRIYRKQKD